MKTTELFVEQVLIGIAVLFTGCLLLSPERLCDLLDADFGEVALVARHGPLQRCGGFRGQPPLPVRA